MQQVRVAEGRTRASWAARGSRPSAKGTRPSSVQNRLPSCSAWAPRGSGGKSSRAAGAGPWSPSSPTTGFRATAPLGMRPGHQVLQGRTQLPQQQQQQGQGSGEVRGPLCTCLCVPVHPSMSAASVTGPNRAPLRQCTIGTRPQPMEVEVQRQRARPAAPGPTGGASWLRAWAPAEQKELSGPDWEPPKPAQPALKPSCPSQPASTLALGGWGCSLNASRSRS